MSFLPKFEEIKLENGLQIVAIPTSTSSVVSVDIFYKVGSRNEIMGKNSGVAHMLEHLNFKSTEKLKAGEFDEIVKGFGGVTNASTGFDYTHYFVRCSNSNLDKTLELFADMMQNLKLSDDEFQTERKVVAEERRWRTDNNPMGLLYFTLFNSAFVYHPYHWTPIGFMDDILHWDIQIIKEFYKAYYQPNNAILVVSGDISSQKLFEVAKKHFDNIKGFESPKPYAVEPKQLGAKRVVLKKQSEVEILALAWKIPNFEHKDMPELSALAHILGSGKSSRLYAKLVDSLKIANSISVYAMEQKDPGLFLILAVCNEGIKAEQVEAEIRAEILKIQKTGLKQSEIDKLKISVKADLIFNLESADHVSELFGEYLARGNLKPLLEVEATMDALTPQGLQRIAKEYFKDETSTTITLINDK
ncbi:MAG: hypothetical protein RL154_647 [Pseudomonadota bacterium]